MHKVDGGGADVLGMRRFRPHLAVVVMLGAALTAACAAPPSQQQPPPTTTPVPTTTTPASACQQRLDDFAAAANAGTYTSPANTVEIDVGVTALDNPSDDRSTGSTATTTMQFTAYDDEGDPIVPSAQHPLHVAVYGGNGALDSIDATTSSDPLTFVLTDGDPVELDYDGGFVPAPITIQAATQLGTTNVCTGTGSWAIGATTLPLANTISDDGSDGTTLPAVCDDPLVDDGSCPTPTIQTTGIRLRAAVGFASGWPMGTTGSAPTPVTDDDLDDFTVDTGSIGVAVPVDDLGPDVIGPAGPAYKYYDSSGYEYMGFLYLASVSVRDVADRTVSSIPIRVLGVAGSGCVAGGSCHSAPDPTTFHYLGVGFDRNAPSPAEQLASPTDNALLQLQSSDPNEHFAPGYIASGAGIEVGLTSDQITAFGFTALTASSVPGDWLTAPGLASIARAQSTPTTAATVLVDTGITEMFVDAAHGEGFHLDDGDHVDVQVTTDDATQSLLDSFQSTSAGVAQTGINPSSVMLLHQQSSGVFVNTGRYVLFGYQYLYDARKGRVGFQVVDPVIPRSP